MENLKEKEVLFTAGPDEEVIQPTCPACENETLIINGRCKTCFTCGWSSCDL